ncbi:MAG TPA: hypothetical protein VFZ21_30990 [Gemmatimonadaceae bacterium]|nr:hypothetical protein [Gemmatimonadaceae bacterium]
MAETLRVLREGGVVSCELYESGALKSAILGPLDVAGEVEDERQKTRPDGVRAAHLKLANRGRAANGGSSE